MFERKPDFDVVYVPDAVDPDDAVRLGAAWLREQAGQKPVLLAAKKSYDNNRLLPQLTAGAVVASGRDAGSQVGEAGRFGRRGRVRRSSARSPTTSPTRSPQSASSSGETAGSRQRGWTLTGR